MKKEDLWHFRNEIKKVARALSIIKKRLNEGRYEEAADSMRREGGNAKQYVQRTQ